MSTERERFASLVNDLNCATEKAVGAFGQRYTRSMEALHAAEAALLAAFDRVCAERDAALRDLASLSKVYDAGRSILAKAEQLVAERDAAAKDAARYRFIRSTDTGVTVLICDAPEHLPDDDWSPEQLDCAVDAAMAKERGT